MSLRTDIAKLLVCCWMLFVPALSLVAAPDSTRIPKDTMPMTLREPAMDAEKEIYANDDFDYVEEENKSSSEDGFFDRLWADLLRSMFEQEEDDYNNYQPGQPGYSPRSSKSAGVNWWTIFFIVIGGGLIVFFIIKATNAGGGKLFKGKSKRKEENIDAALDDVDIHAITYEDEISKAVRQQDYRFAVRLWFLRSLKEMSDHQLINWKIDKTNSDYYYELSGSKLQKEFGSVSLLYDYVWYGEFKLNELRYQDAEKELKNYLESIKAQEVKKK